MDKLSAVMQEVLEVLKEHKELVRYDGGFWSWKGIELKRTTFNRMDNLYVPIWHCDVKTLRALHKRGLVELDKTANICRIIEQTAVTKGGTSMTVKELREKTGLTQQKFGDYLGIPRRTIQNWENGVNECNQYIIDLMEYKLKNEGVIKNG